MTDTIDLSKLPMNAITNLSAAIAKKIYNKSKSYINDQKSKDDINFGTAFEEYLVYSSDSYSKIKTILYRHTPQYIYSFYECVGVSRNKKELIDTADINNLLKIGNRLIITGTGGIGKSVMMKHLFLNTVINTELVPIFIELRSLNNIEKNNINIEKHIYNTVRTLKLNIEKKYFDYSLEMGCYVVLFDGFDELKSEISNIVTEKIFELCDKYPNNYYIVSSRPLQEFIGWNQFEELKANRLTKNQALSLINKLDYDTTVKAKFAEALESELYVKYRSFASTPLLLTIMLMTFENRYSMPDKLNDFFEQAFTTLFHTHDATKTGYSREKLCGLGFEDFKTIFAHFCFKSFFNSDFEFTESKAIEYIEKSKQKKLINKDFKSEDFFHDLTNSVCMLMRDGLNYKFSHRSFQEYFAAVYTVQLYDEQQKEFIKKWLTGDLLHPNSSYLDMLYDLQPARFVKNIISPALQELNENFEKNNSSEIWLLRELIDEIMLTNSEDVFNIIVHITNHYYFDMLKRCCLINNYNKILYKYDENFIHFLKDNYGINEPIDINEIIELGYESDLINALQWIINRFIFAKNNVDTAIDNYEKTSIGDMLDQL